MFLDEAIIDVSGGKGGDGCVAWRREKYVPNGGPDGGDGGRGGNVIIIADSNTDTLSVFASKKRFHAQNGEKGMGKGCSGKGADHLLLPVPPGTLVFQMSDTVGGQKKRIADLRNVGDSIVVARGGRGGFGNAHFKTSTRQAPDFAELGEPGQHAMIALELKLVADVGIIGFPSVGKSSLIAAVSSAKPKIAAYEFTTLVPNLGVVHHYDRSFVLCDIPGLIDGASTGKGLGDAFLKHVERCGILLHLLDINRPDIVEDYKVIRKELASYSPVLAQKKEIVVLNKIDLTGGDVDVFVEALRQEGISVFGSISTVTRAGLPALMSKLLPLVLHERDQRAAFLAESDMVGDVPVLRPHLESDQMGVYSLTRQADGSVLISGKRIEQFTIMTNFQSQSAVQRFNHVLERVGVIKALERLGDLPKVFIGKTDVTEHVVLD